ncbi:MULTISPECIES: RelA/SpoT domain-containing protein [unclassified Pseudomonas]|uniref:RelA/SpoT domain-containing protein n=1 Tax=unclassified Pseudomonas TaxID=196821 RepID=UPI00131DBEAB|nr:MULTISPECIES: RelA/SpoT domain-containing protein [unclassified Pseudomonas]
MNLKSFKRDNRITDEMWRAADIPWETLSKIGEHHTQCHGDLERIAEYCAGILRASSSVHSVRWRVKDAQHLMEKIVRRRAKGAEHYKEISLDNYQSVVADLIGIRALHLFKDEWLEIDKMIRAHWDLEEQPLIYYRKGDEVKSIDPNDVFDKREHEAGYRSMHYVFASSPGRRKVLVELQVRTIFEEGWSEIDHRVRYPNFSDNALVGYFLGIFNRLAGSADEMGTYVKSLASDLAKANDNMQSLKDEHNQTLGKLEAALKELSAAGAENDASRKAIKDMETQMAALKRQSSKMPSAGMVTIGSTLRETDTFLTVTANGLISAPLFTGSVVQAGQPISSLIQSVVSPGYQVGESLAGNLRSIKPKE